MSKQIGIPPDGVVVAGVAALFVLSWSSGFLVAKAGTVHASALTLLLWRFALVSAVLWALALVRRPRLDREHLARQWVVGLLSQLGYVLPVYGAISLGVGAGTTSLVDAVQPVVVATLVGPLLGLRVRPVQWAGLVVAVVGVAFLVSSDLRDGSAPAGAYVLPALAVASLVAATFVARRGPAAPVLTVLTVHATVTTAALVLVAVLAGAAVPPSEPRFWVLVLFLAGVTTLAAYACYWYLLRRVDITVLNALLFLVVPTTTVGGWLLFDEPFGVVTVTGLLLAGVGVTAVVRGDRRVDASTATTPAGPSRPRQGASTRVPACRRPRQPVSSRTCASSVGSDSHQRA